MQLFEIKKKSMNIIFDEQNVLVQYDGKKSLYRRQCVFIATLALDVYTLAIIGPIIPFSSK